MFPRLKSLSMGLFGLGMGRKTHIASIVIIAYLPILGAELKWQSVSSFAPLQRQAHKAVVHNNRIFVFTGHEWDENPQSWVGKSDVVSSADGINWTVESSAVPFSMRGWATACSFNGKLWLYSGTSPAQPIISDMWSSTDGKSWQKVFDTPPFANRQEASMLSFGGKMWIIGGRGTNPQSSLKDVWNTTDGVNWVQVTSGAAFPGGGMAGTVHNGAMWIINGNVWSSTDGITWSLRSELAAGGFWGDFVSSNGVLYANYSYDQVYIWSSSTGASWSWVTSLHVGGRRNRLVSFNNKLWRVGGDDQTVYSTEWYYTLAITSSPSNHSIDVSPSSSTYKNGTSVQLTAQPSFGYKFSHWSGDASGTTNPITLIVDKDRSVTGNISSYAQPIPISDGFDDANLANRWGIYNGSVTVVVENGSYVAALSGTEGTSFLRFLEPSKPTLIEASVKFGTTGTPDMEITATSPGFGGLVLGFRSISATQLKVTDEAAALLTTLNRGTWYRTRFELIWGTGSSVTAKYFIWPVGSAMPSTPLKTFTTDMGNLNLLSFSSGIYGGEGGPIVLDNVLVSDAPPQQWPLTLRYLNGSITKDPNLANFPSGSTVKLTATPIAGYDFTGWTGDATGTTNPLTTTMDKAKTIEAGFTIRKYDLNITVANGAVDKIPNKPKYDHGEVVELWPRKTGAFVFTGWSGTDGIGKATPLYITMDKTRSVTANFASEFVTLTFGSMTNGSIVASPKPVNGKYIRGQSIKLTAKPVNTNYKVASWNVPGTVTTNEGWVNVNMDADKTVSAVFVAKPWYALNITQPANGKISVSPKPGANGYIEGSVPILTATRNPGYGFTGWTGNASGTTPTYNIFMNGVKNVSATFTQLPPLKLVVVNAAGSAEKSVTPELYHAITTTVPDYKGFSHWEIEALTGTVTYRFENAALPGTKVMISGGDARVTARFVDTKLKVEVYENAKGSGDINKSKPQFRLTSLNTGSLKNWEIHYYFKAECQRTPSAIWTAPPPAGWSIQIADADGNGVEGGNYILRVIYNGPTPLAAKGTVISPPGLEMTLSNITNCTGCNVWNRINDPSGPKSIKTWTLAPLVSVYKYDVAAIPPLKSENLLAGTIPSLIVDPPVNQPPSEDRPVVPVPLPVTTATPQPNLTFSQAFPIGDFLVNGSFENDSLGWKKSHGTGVSWQIMDQTSSDGAYDGNRFLKVSPSGTAVEGVYIEVPETHAAYSFLLNKKTVTLSAWVKNPPGTSGVNEVQLVLLNNGDNGAPLANKFSLNDGWQFCYQTFQNIEPVKDGSDMKFRFAIVQAAATANFPFYLDGVSLVVGEKAQPPVLNYRYTTSRHAEIQRKSFLPGADFGYNPAASRLLISNTQNDALGRVWKSYMTFVRDCAGPDCNAVFDSSKFVSGIDDAKNVFKSGNAEGYPDAGNFPYSELVYEHDQATSVIREGKAGTNFHVASGHTVESHYSGVTDTAIAGLGSDFKSPSNRSNPKLSYKYVSDENGNLALEWKNGFGQVIKRSSPVTIDGAKKYASTNMKYDDRGNLAVIVSPEGCERINVTDPPNTCVDNIRNVYDDENLIWADENPDAGTTLYYYDLLGRLRMKQMAHQAKARKFTVTRYDVLGRTSEIGEYSWPTATSYVSEFRDKARDLQWPADTDPNWKSISKFYYDKMPPAVPEEFSGYGSAFKIYPESESESFPFSRGRLCAVVTKQPVISALSKDDLTKVEEVSSSAYKYDKYGNVVATYTYNGFVTNPQFKLQKSEAVYDPQGRIIETLNFNKAEDIQPARRNRYSYDNQGRVSEILDNAGKSIAQYSYFDVGGKIKTIILDGNDGDYIRLNYRYDIKGGVSSVKAERPVLANPLLFSETVLYDVPDAGIKPQFNGSISEIKYNLAGLANAADGNRRLWYDYDELSRLKKVVFDVMDNVTNSKDDKYDAGYAYDLNGRITSQRTGSKAASAVTSGGEYGYHSSSNRLAFVNDGLGDGPIKSRKGSESDPNFKYDAAGNMIQDRSKLLEVQYDYRGLPLAFTYQDGTKTKQVVARYDGAGQRITKIDFEQTTESSSQFLVDPDASRQRDHSTLRDAYEALKAKAATWTTSPPYLIIHLVYETAPYKVPLTGITKIVPLPMKDGEHKVKLVIRKLQFNSPEYWDVLASRKGMGYIQASHYTKTGNELRQTGASKTTVPKIFTSLPLGLGRYGNGSQEKVFNIKNHLGSTVIGASSLSSEGYDVYEYFAYGKEFKESNRLVEDEMITETFTGKELDNKIGLQYFGARYYDPELALWISPDAARQFASLYAYSPNPVSSVDPDGNYSMEGLAGYMANFLGFGDNLPDANQNLANFSSTVDKAYDIALHARAVRGYGQLSVPGLQIKAQAGNDLIGVTFKPTMKAFNTGMRGAISHRLAYVAGQGFSYAPIIEADLYSWSVPLAATPGGIPVLFDGSIGTRLGEMSGSFRPSLNLGVGLGLPTWFNVGAGVEFRGQPAGM